MNTENIITISTPKYINRCYCSSTRTYAEPFWQDDEIKLDDCIADAIVHLWNNGIRTVRSSCGKGTNKPSVMLHASSANRVNEAGALIHEMDSFREWEVQVEKNNEH